MLWLPVALNCHNFNLSTFNGSIRGAVIIAEDVKLALKLTFLAAVHACDCVSAFGLDARIELQIGCAC